MTDIEAVTRAVELLLNSLYPAQRGEVLDRLDVVYNRGAKPPPYERRESCRRCGEVRLVNIGGFCHVCSGLWLNSL